MVFGYEITMPPQIFKNISPYNYDNYAEMTRRELHDAWYLAKERLMDRKAYNKTQYDKKTNPVDVQPGDLVLIRNQAKKGKHDMVWLGPFEVDWAEEKYVTIQVNGAYRKVSKDDLKLSKACCLPDDSPDKSIARMMRQLLRINDKESDQETISI